MSVKKCCVPNCGNTCNSGQTLHSFPNPAKDMDRFRTWIYAVGGDILSLDNNTIFKLRRVCHAHFEPKYHTRSHLLSANAVPTLNLPGFSIVKRQPMHNITNKTQKGQPAATAAATSSIKMRDDGQPPFASCSHVKENDPSTVKGSSIPKKRQEDQFSASNKMHEDGQPPVASSSHVQENDPSLVDGKRKKPLYAHHSNEAQHLKNKLYKLRRAKDSLQTKLKKAMKLDDNPTLKQTLKFFTSAAIMFIMMQFREGKKNKLGRRFKKNEKMLALALYKQGPRAYRWLRKLFVLPSPLTLTRMISSASLKAGLNENIFKQLKRRVQKMNANQKLCVLLFDEIALKPHFDYNRRRDAIIGFVDNGENTQYKIADHALVFMIKGVFHNYKQAIAYTFCSGSTSKQELVVQIKNIIRKLQSIGLIVLGTICDQGCANVAAINSLIEENAEKYKRNGKELRNKVFEIDGEEIIPIFDTPHLLKGIRNNLLCKDLKYTTSGGVEKTAKWDHILNLYKEDPAYQGLRLMPKLTDKHVIPEKIAKMKVKCASQVFSQSVAVNMGYLASKGILPKECQDTAEILLFFDQLFDSLNGSYENSKKRAGKPLLGPVTPKSIHKKIWTDAKQVLKTMRFVDKKGKLSVVPSIKNWIFSIENVEHLINKLFNKYNLTSIWMRHLNQDALENFFGSIRSHGYRNISPTCAGFENAFASLLINNISSMHSPGQNCEQDSGKVFKSLRKIFFEKPAEVNPHTDIQIDFDLLFSDNFFVDLEEKIKDPKIQAQLIYVTGYALKKSKKVFKSCVTCKNDLISDECNSYISLRERVGSKRLLTYPTQKFTLCFSQMQDVINYVVKNNITIKNIKNYIKTLFAVVINYDFLTCEKHKKEVIRVYEDVTCNVFLYNWCKVTNDLLDGKRTEAEEDDKTQIMACQYYNKRLKK